MDIVLPDLEKVHRLSELNLARCESPVGFSAKLYDLSMLEWANAMMGEAGEASNKIHKYNEIIKGRRPGRAHSLISSIADEIADTVIYLDLVMRASGIEWQRALESVYEQIGTQLREQAKITIAERAALLPIFAARLAQCCVRPAQRKGLLLSEPDAGPEFYAGAVVMQAAIVAALFNFDLWTAICDKWNHTSAKILYTRARLH